MNLISLYSIAPVGGGICENGRGSVYVRMYNIKLMYMMEDLFNTR